MGLERIGNPLQDLLSRLKLAEPIQGWKAVEIWPEVVGETVAARAQAVAFRDGVLVVSVENPVWMQELTYLKRRIVDQLNQRLGDNIVRDIRLQPGSSGTAKPDQRGDF